jgi:hypothetical protein
MDDFDATPVDDDAELDDMTDLDELEELDSLDADPLAEEVSQPTRRGADLEADEVLLLEEVEEELVLAVWEPTGEPGVDAALDLLGQLDPDDVHQHAAVFTDIHQRLRATLTDLDAPS